MGRAFIKGVLNSARGLHPEDCSPEAKQQRCIQGFWDLDGIEFVARVDIESKKDGSKKNTIKYAITPDNPEYASVFNGACFPQGVNHSSEDQQLMTQGYHQPAGQQVATPPAPPAQYPPAGQQVATPPAPPAQYPPAGQQVATPPAPPAQYPPAGQQIATPPAPPAQYPPAGPQNTTQSTQSDNRQQADRPRWAE